MRNGRQLKGFAKVPRALLNLPSLLGDPVEANLVFRLILAAQYGRGRKSVTIPGRPPEKRPLEPGEGVSSTAELGEMIGHGRKRIGKALASLRAKQLPFLVITTRGGRARAGAGVYWKLDVKALGEWAQAGASGPSHADSSCVEQTQLAAPEVSRVDTAKKGVSCVGSTRPEPVSCVGLTPELCLQGPHQENSCQEKAPSCHERGPSHPCEENGNELSPERDDLRCLEDASLDRFAREAITRMVAPWPLDGFRSWRTLDERLRHMLTSDVMRAVAQVATVADYPRAKHRWRLLYSRLGPRADGLPPLSPSEAGWQAARQAMDPEGQRREDGNGADMGGGRSERS